MDEIVLGVFGCSVVLGIPGVLLWAGLRLHRRLRTLENELESLKSGILGVVEGVPTATTERGGEGTRGEEQLDDDAVADELDSDGSTLDEDCSLPTFDMPVADVSGAEFSDRPNWEERVGTRLPVWIGAVAFALAAAFLVKLSFDQGWIGPTVRVAIGIAFGIALLMGGELLRSRQRYLGQGLTAAGLAALFVAFYAATTLYSLVGPFVGFTLLALTAATGVALSTRQGPIVATIGLVGGFSTPALVGSADSSSGILFGYLLLLQVGLVVVTRQRGWWWLAFLAQVGSLMWVFTFLSNAFHIQDAPLVGGFVLASVATLCVSLVRGGEAWGGGAIRMALGLTAMGGGLAASGALVEAGDHGAWGWTSLALLAMASFVLGRFDGRYLGLAWLSAAWSLLLLASWSGELGLDDLHRFSITSAALVALLAIGSGSMAWRSERAGRWLSLSGASSIVGLLVIASAGKTKLGLEDFSWGGLAVAIAAVYVGVAVPMARRRAAGQEGLDTPLAALAVTATTLVSLSLPLELDHAWLTVGWALEIVLVLWLAGRLRVPALTRMAEILTVLVAVRLLLNPAVLDYPIGALPVFNWLLYGYGVPLLSAGAALVLARRLGAEQLQRALETLVPLFAAAWCVLTIRHAVHGRLAGAEIGLRELGGWAIAASLVALGGFYADRRFELPGMKGSSRFLVGVAVGVTFLGLALARNPLWAPESVGSSLLFNAVVWVYGGTALVLAATSRRLTAGATSSPVDRWLARGSGVASLLSLFLCVTLEVRHAFRGQRLDQGGASSGEDWAVSIAWVVLGIALAVLAGVRRNLMVRYGSLIVMLVAVIKVFLFDTARLEGAYRVLSLFGLGVSLFVLAFLYQRFFVSGDRQVVPDD